MKYLWNVVAAFVLAALAHLPVVQGILDLDDAADTFAWMITVGGLLYVVGSTVLFRQMDRLEKDVKDATETLRETRAAPEVTALRDDDFYARFKAAAEGAEHSVWIAYLGPHAPDRANRSERDRYYKEILQVMRENPKVRFRRLVRETAGNRTWLAGRLPEWAALPNVSVALLPDLPAETEMPRALSVQLVDRRIGWLVAVEGHEPRGRPHRDLEIRDSTVADFLGRYYERLWGQARPLLEDGQLTPQGLDFQREMEG